MNYHSEWEEHSGQNKQLVSRSCACHGKRDGEGLRDVFLEKVVLEILWSPGGRRKLLHQQGHFTDSKILCGT